ncbi:MAG: MFS transporter [Flavobacteriales bacterium]|nr:MFS transporter [Flavobacteriales bacterium]
MSLSGSSPGFAAQRTVYPVLFAIAFSHLLNDTVQALIPAIYPLVKASYQLSYAQIGLITLTFQTTASILQPLVGHWTDKRPRPFALVGGMGSTLVGLLVLSQASSLPMILAAVALVGIGSSIFHPEASRMAFTASGGKRSLSQSVFQLGGNAGSALGPLLAAAVIVPFGQATVGWFVMLPLVAMLVLWRVGQWYLRVMAIRQRRSPAASGPVRSALPRRKVVLIIATLLLLIFSKQFYVASMTSYYTFYLIGRFGLSVQEAQVQLFIFLFAAAIGTLLGGFLGDRIGYKRIVWASILGAAPFTLALPHADLFWTGVLAFMAGFILASAFSAILVYAQLLIPGRVGLVSGLFFGFAFGMAGLGSALLGRLADATDIDTVFRVCSFLPLLGLLCWYLPDQKRFA